MRQFVSTAASDRPHVPVSNDRWGVDHLPLVGRGESAILPATVSTTSWIILRLKSGLRSMKPET